MTAFRRHLGAWRFARYSRGMLTVRDCANNLPCDKYLRYGLGRRHGTNVRLQKVLDAFGESIFIYRMGRRGRDLPVSIVDVGLHERDRCREWRGRLLESGFCGTWGVCGMS